MTEATSQTPGAGGGASTVVTGADKGAQATDFLSTIPEGARDYVANKGWKDAASILSSYQQLESKIGANRIELPKEGDAESEKAFRKALGVPDAADKYEFKFPDGTKVNEDFLKVAKSWFHEAGATPKQAAVLAQKWAEYGNQMQTEAAAATLKAIEGERDAVFKEWGNNKEANQAAMQRAFMLLKPVGFDEGMIDAIAETPGVGMAKVMKIFAHIGSMVSEGRFVDGSGGANGLTAEAAAARMKTLKGDREWFAKYTKGDAAAVAEWNALNAVLAKAAEQRAA